MLERRWTRRACLTALTTGTAATAGCLGSLGGDGDDGEQSSPTNTEPTPATTESTPTATVGATPTAEATDTETETPTETENTAGEDRMLTADLSVQELQSRFEDLSGDMRMDSLTGYQTASDPAAASTVRFTAVWGPDPGGNWAAFVDRDRDEFQGKFDELADEGLRPVEFTAYRKEGEAQYGAIWEPIDGEWRTRHHQNFEQYASTYDQLRSQGLRLQDVAGVGGGDDGLFASTWHEGDGTDWIGFHGQSRSEARATLEEQADREFSPVVFDGYRVGTDDVEFATIYERDPDDTYRVVTDTPQDELEDSVATLNDEGYRVVDISGYAPGGETQFALVGERA